MHHTMLSNTYTHISVCVRIPVREIHKFNNGRNIWMETMGVVYSVYTPVQLLGHYMYVYYMYIFIAPLLLGGSCEPEF